jgi:predicted nucleic acid-binding protein
METKQVKVQITLEGQDAQLYRMLINKKHGLSAALKSLYRNDEIRSLFFNETAIEMAVALALPKTSSSSSLPNNQEVVAPVQKKSKKEW